MKRQSQLQECRLAVAGRAIDVILYAVEWQRPTDLATHYLTAHWKVAPNTYAGVIATGKDSVAQAEFLAALRTVVFAPR